MREGLCYQILEKELESYRSESLKILNKYDIDKDFSYDDDFVTLINSYKKIRKITDELSMLNFPEFNVDIGIKIKGIYKSKIDEHMSALSILENKEREEIANLRKKKDSIVRGYEEDLKRLDNEALKVLQPYTDKHNYLINRRNEIEEIFNIYNLPTNEYNIQTENMTLEEIDEMLSLCIYAVDKSLRNPNTLNKVAELFYLPSVMTFKSNDVMVVAKIVYLISFLLICIFCKPILAIICIMYLINNIANLHNVYERKNLLQIGYAMSEEIDFRQYIEKDKEYIEVYKNLKDVKALDLSDDIKSIEDKYNDKKQKLDSMNPEGELNKEMIMYSAMLSSPEYEQDLHDIKRLLERKKEDIKSEYLKAMDYCEDIFRKVPNTFLGSAISESVVLSTKMAIGAITLNGKKLVEYKSDFGLDSMCFTYKDEKERVEVTDYVKLLLCNTLSNITTKHLYVHIYDKENIGRDFGEFIDPTLTDYIEIVTNDFDKLYKKVKAVSEKNLSRYKVDSIQSFNKIAEEKNMVPIDYHLMIVCPNDEGIERRVEFQNFMKYSADTGVIVWYIGKDPSLYKKEEVQLMEQFYSNQSRCKGYGKTISREGKVLDVLPDVADPYKYNFEIGQELMKLYKHTCDTRSEKSIIYNQHIRDKFQLKEKMWTFDTINGIELHFGLEDGDPNSFTPLILGDDTVHCLTGGRTGSGKSVFINQTLASLLYMYSPEWLELVMIDFKNIEFKKFKNEFRLPHTRIVAGTKDGEYAVSIFSFLEEEMARRNKIFDKWDVKKISDYNKKVLSMGKKDLIMPRILFLIDEFQVMFQQVDAKSLDKIKTSIVALSKLARSCGCHLWFTSQSMKGTMSADILAQFGLRTALGCDAETSTEIIGRDDSKTIKDKGYLYSNSYAGEPTAPLKFWRTPYIPDGELEEMIKLCQKKCVDEGHLDRNSKFFDEDETFEHSLLTDWNRNEILAGDDYNFVLGERTSYSTNTLPCNFSLDRDNSENIVVGAFEPLSLVRLTNTVISDIASKSDTDLIVSCCDKDIGTLLNIEGKVKPKYKIFLDPYEVNLEQIIDFLKGLIDKRKSLSAEELEKEKIIYFMGLVWNKMEGLGGRQDDKLKEILNMGPKYRIHFIMVVRDFQEMRNFRNSFNHKICSYMDEKSSDIMTGSSKPSGKNLDNLGFYFYGTKEMKFKLYTFPIEGKIKQRELVAKE